jgi:hypothetical protein
VYRIQTQEDRVSWPEQLSTCQAHGGNCVLGWRKGNGNGNFHDVGADHVSGNHKSRQAKTCVPSLDDSCSHAYASGVLTNATVGHILVRGLVWE